MKFKIPGQIRLKKGVLYIPLVLGFLILMGFVSAKQSDKTVRSIFVHIDYEHDNYFINREDALALMTRNNQDILIGAPVDNINLKALELRIKTHNFVEEAQVFKDHKGNLSVKITQCRPVARVIHPSGPHAYIGSNGQSLPSSDKFTARVLVIDGPYAENLKNNKFLASEQGKKYLELINFVNDHDFWSAQIAQMTVNGDGNIVLMPQVGDQIIEFGKPEKIEEKFAKLFIYYKKIVPMHGYNRFSRVNLKYKDQIVCE